MFGHTAVGGRAVGYRFHIEYMLGQSRLCVCILPAQAFYGMPTHTTND
jgi:hypothetical protein